MIFYPGLLLQLGKSDVIHAYKIYVKDVDLQKSQLRGLSDKYLPPRHRAQARVQAPEPRRAPHPARPAAAVHDAPAQGLAQAHRPAPARLYRAQQGPGDCGHDDEQDQRGAEDF